MVTDGLTRDVKRNAENGISVLETSFGSLPSENEIRIYFFHFCQLNYIKMTKYQLKLIHTFFNVE